MHKAIFEILRTGTHRGGTGTITLSENNLSEIHKFYSPDLRNAPLVIGHPLDDKPELGKVTNLYLHKDKLFAGVEITNDLVKKIQNGEISGISAAMYFSEAKENPVKGLGMYLKHVGFLERGKNEPAVKGMLNPEISVAHIATFSEDENSFILLNDGGYTHNPELGELHQKALYFENVLGVTYQQALDVIQGA